MGKEQKRIKVFIDASVLFAASDSATGASREIIRYALRRTIVPVINELVLEETERSLASKRPKALSMFQILKDTLLFAVVEPTLEEIVAMWPYTEFGDAPHFASAKKAGVDYIVSLDRKHMVNIRDQVCEQTGLRILLPEELLEELRNKAVLD